MIKSLIFDFDGLIIDTEMPEYEAWKDIYREYGHDFPFENWASIVGGTGASDFDPHKHLEELAGRKFDRGKLWETRSRDYLRNVQRQPILPGVLDIMEEADDIGLSLGLASSSPEKWIHGHLNRLDLFERFQSIKTADDVKKTKPDPALFNAVMSELRISPEEGIVFEDSLNGVSAAKSAGLYCVAVPNPLTARLDLDRADLQLTSLAGIGLGGLINQLIG